MKKLVKFLYIILFITFLTSCNNDSIYQIESDKINGQISSIENYTFKFTTYSYEESVTINFYYSENVCKFEHLEHTQIYSCEGDKYYCYIQEKKYSNWIVSEVLETEFDSFKNNFFRPFDIKDEHLSKLEYNSSTKKYEYNENNESGESKLSIGFKNSIIENIVIESFENQNKSLLEYTNINSTTILLPNVDKAS